MEFAERSNREPQDYLDQEIPEEVYFCATCGNETGVYKTTEAHWNPKEHFCSKDCEDEFHGGLD